MGYPSRIESRSTPHCQNTSAISRLQNSNIGKWLGSRLRLLAIIIPISIHCGIPHRTKDTPDVPYVPINEYKTSSTSKVVSGEELERLNSKIFDIIKGSKSIHIVDSVDDYVFGIPLGGPGARYADPKMMLAEPAFLTISKPEESVKNLRSMWDCFGPFILFLLHDKQLGPILFEGMEIPSIIAKDYYENTYTKNNFSFRESMDNFWVKTRTFYEDKIGHSPKISEEERSRLINFLTISSLIGISSEIELAPHQKNPDDGKTIQPRRYAALCRSSFSFYSFQYGYIPHSEDGNHAQIDKYYEYYYFAYLTFLVAYRDGKDMGQLSFWTNAGTFSGIARHLVDQTQATGNKKPYYKDIPYDVMYNVAGSMFGKDIALSPTNNSNSIGYYLSGARNSALVRNLMAKYNP